MPRTEEEIRQKAYAIWESEGRPEGQDFRHWTEAVRDIEAAARKAASADMPVQKTTRAKKPASSEAPLGAAKKTTRGKASRPS